MWRIRKCKYLPDLPEEIMIEILLRLPVDAVHACKCLSKQWYNLIGNPKFFNLYRACSSVAFFVSQGTLHCVLMKQHKLKYYKASLGVPPPYTVHPLPLFIHSNSDSDSDSDSNSDLDIGLADELLPGWSNGIVCVKGENGHFFIYNLLTRTSYRVSDTPQQRDPLSWLYHGFGYNSNADDYKILVVCNYEATSPRGQWLSFNDSNNNSIRGDEQNKDNSLFWVYSIKNRGWEVLDGFPYDAYSYYDKSSVFGGAYSFNGVLHFVATTRRKQPSEVILTFDLHTCMFGEMLLPSTDEPLGWYSRSKVTELDGRLCLLCESNFDTLKAWVMKDESWTNLFSFNYSGSTMSCFFMPQLSYSALYETQDGSKLVLLVCHASRQCYWHDINNNNNMVTML